MRPNSMLLLMVVSLIIGLVISIVAYVMKDKELSKLQKTKAAVEAKCIEARVRAQAMKSDDERRLAITALEMSAWIELCGKGEQANSIRDGALTPGKFGDVRKALSEI
jgi:hypothetical protein